jgi:hypothetical protein
MTNFESGGNDLRDVYMNESQDDYKKSLLNRGRELLTITVEIGNGESENIVIYEFDSAEEVAEKFSQRYFLGPDLKSEFTK